jgi:feruloyl-CoA synthase
MFTPVEDTPAPLPFSCLRQPSKAKDTGVSVQDNPSRPVIKRENRADGTILLRNTTPLPEPMPDILDRWRLWVRNRPDAVFVSERADGAIRTTSYGEMDRISDHCALSLRDAGCAPGDVVAVAARASMTHAALKIAALKAGLVHVPLSPLLLETGYGQKRLDGLLAIANPKLTLGPDNNPPLPRAQTCGNWSDLDDFVGKADGHGPFVSQPASSDDPAAIYFTSGSTGDPKGVQITRGMIASNQSAYAAHWPFLTKHPPVLIDWLPWHHVFGGLDNFFKMIWNGGAYHIETPPNTAHMDAMAARIRDVRPTIHINVPYGIDLLLDTLDRSPETRAALFERLDLIFFAGAGMSDDTWQRLQTTVRAATHGRGETPLVVSGYGATEAASTMCLGWDPAMVTSEIGLPLPGHTVRLTPVDDGATEIRFRGPNLAPGYIGPGGLTPLDLDDNGFLRTGDLGRARDEGKPENGLCFDGRIAEDFKLTTGTRVKVGALRHALLAACAPHLQDVAIAGSGRDRIAVILFPTEAARTSLTPTALRTHMLDALNDHNRQHPGSSTSVSRALVSNSPPDRDAGEITDKGHLAQSRTLKNRTTQVTRLYAEPSPADILCPDTLTRPAAKQEASP